MKDEARTTGVNAGVDPTQAAVDAIAHLIHDTRCRDRATHDDYEGCVNFYRDHAASAVAALQADRSLLLGLLGIDAEATKAEAEHWVVSNPDEHTQRRLTGASYANIVWERALAGDPS